VRTGQRRLPLNPTYVDIGELGWSLYLSAHVRWVYEQGCRPEVFAPVDRCPLYMDCVECVTYVPRPFYEQFGQYSQNGFGLYGVGHQRLLDWFRPHFSREHVWNGYQQFGCHWLDREEMIFRPYGYRHEYPGRRILVFPRQRSTYYPSDSHAKKHPKHLEKRNLPAAYYQRLVERLCVQHPDHIVTVVGKTGGVCEVRAPAVGRFESWVKPDGSIQELIDLCQYASCAIGGTSAPPKITMLQGVPTAVIGHEKQRFSVDENWLDTLMWFYEVPEAGDYSQLDIEDCVERTCAFVEKVVT